MAKASGGGLGNPSLSKSDKQPRSFTTPGKAKWAARTKTSVGKSGPVTWTGGRPTSGRGNVAGRQRRRVTRS